MPMSARDIVIASHRVTVFSDHHAPLRRSPINASAIDLNVTQIQAYGE
jgi:hypothetical protein